MMAFGLIVLAAASTLGIPDSVDAIAKCDTAAFVQNQASENEKIGLEMESISRDSQPLLKLKSDLIYYRASADVATVEGKPQPRQYVDANGNEYSLKQAEKIMKVIDSQLESIKFRNFLVKARQDNLERSLNIFQSKCRGSDYAPNQ